MVKSNECSGLCAGLVVSTFSRSLALILGLLVVGVQVSFNGKEGRKRKGLIRYSGHLAMESTSSPTIACKNMSRALTFGSRYKTT